MILNFKLVIPKFINFLFTICTEISLKNHSIMICFSYFLTCKYPWTLIKLRTYHSKNWLAQVFCHLSSQMVNYKKESYFSLTDNCLLAYRKRMQFFDLFKSAQNTRCKIMITQVSGVLRIYH